MRKTYLLVLFLALVMGWSATAFGYESAQGWCENGGQIVQTGGRGSSTLVQASYPSCVVTVYNAGTVVKATIYSTSTGTVISGSSFNATSTGHWQFYADSGTYDIVLSGGSPAFPSPITLRAVPIAGITPSLVSALPTCNSTADGQSRAVTDSATATWGATVTGSGSNHVLVYCNGTSWTITAK